MYNAISIFYGCFIFNFMTIFFNQQVCMKIATQVQPHRNSYTHKQSAQELFLSFFPTFFFRVFLHSSEMEWNSLMYEIRKYYRKIRIHFYILFVYVYLQLKKIRNIFRYTICDRSQIQKYCKILNKTMIFKREFSGERKKFVERKMFFFVYVDKEHEIFWTFNRP